MANSNNDDIIHLSPVHIEIRKNDKQYNQLTSARVNNISISDSEFVILDRNLLTVRYHHANDRCNAKI